MAVAAADADDIKLHERLKKRVAVAVRKEEKDAQLAEKGLARDLDRWERYVAATEADAQVAESAAQEAKERAALLANKKAEKEVLHKAYEQALYVESKSAAARAAAIPEAPPPMIAITIIIFLIFKMDKLEFDEMIRRERIYPFRNLRLSP